MITFGDCFSRVFVNFVENLYPLTTKYRIKVALFQLWSERLLQISVCTKANYTPIMLASFRFVLFSNMEKNGIKCFTVNTTFLEAIFQWEGNVGNISDLNSLQISCSDKRVFLDIKKDY